MLQQLTAQLIEGLHLSRQETSAAMEAVFTNNIPDAAIASFLTALTIKGETPDEIAGFASMMRRHAVRL